MTVNIDFDALIKKTQEVYVSKVNQWIMSDDILFSQRYLNGSWTGPDQLKLWEDVYPHPPYEDYDSYEDEL